MITTESTERFELCNCLMHFFEKLKRIMYIKEQKLPLRKSSRPRDKYGGRTWPGERRDAKSARKEAS